MKKLTAFILTAVLMLSLGVFALADGTTTLTTTVPAATYTLTIPKDMEVTYGKSDVDVKSLDATAVSGFAVGKNLKVTVNYTPFECKNVSTTIPYKVNAIIEWSRDDGNKDLGLINSGASLLFKCTGTNSLVPTTLSGDIYGALYFFHLTFDNSDWGKALAGDYIATMTFTSEVVAAE